MDGYLESCLGNACKILKYMGEGQDVRGLNCKIFPYKHTLVQQGDDVHPGIYLKVCPATQPTHSVPIEFTNQVIKLVKEHYSKILDKVVDVEIIDGVPEA
jgi:hypothetical protein